MTRMVPFSTIAASAGAIFTLELIAWELDDEQLDRPKRHT